MNQHKHRLQMQSPEGQRTAIMRGGSFPSAAPTINKSSLLCISPKERENMNNQVQSWSSAFNIIKYPNVMANEYGNQYNAKTSLRQNKGFNSNNSSIWEGYRFSPKAASANPIMANTMMDDTQATSIWSRRSPSRLQDNFQSKQCEDSFEEEMDVDSATSPLCKRYSDREIGKPNIPGLEDDLIIAFGMSARLLSPSSTNSSQKSFYTAASQKTTKQNKEGRVQNENLSQINDDENHSFENRKVNQVISGQDHKSKFYRCIGFIFFIIKALMCVCSTAIVCLFAWAIYLYQMDTQCTLGLDMDVTTLRENLLQNVYGQDIAISNVILHTKKFLHEKNNEDPLVFLFAGGTGVGKSYSSQLIAQNVDRANVHSVIIPMHFPEDVTDFDHAIRINDWIMKNLTICKVNLFILEEIEFATDSFIDGVLESIEYLQLNKGQFKVVFILTSLLGTNRINELSYQYNAGLVSVKPSYIQLEELIKAELKISKWKGIGSVTKIIPFMPLEKKHVLGCIQKILQMRNLDVDSAFIHKILEYVSFFPGNDPTFSRSGCGKIPLYIDILLTGRANIINIDPHEEF